MFRTTSGGPSQINSPFPASVFSEMAACINKDAWQLLCVTAAAKKLGDQGTPSAPPTKEPVILNCEQ